MPSLLPAAVIGSAAVGGVVSSNAAGKAAKASQSATDQTLALQKQQYDQTRADLSPYTSAGGNALTTLQDRLNGSNVFSNTGPASASDPQNFSYGADDYTASPAYASQLKGGVDAINSSMAARGALGSGATLKALDKFGSDLALQDFSNERNYAAGRYDTDRNYQTNRYDTATAGLTGMTNLGESAAAGVGNAGLAAANASGNALQQGANSTANAGLVSSNNLTSLLGQGVNALAYSQRPTNQQIVNQYTPGFSYTPGSYSGPVEPTSIY